MKDQLFAQILKGLVVNIIVIDDPQQIPIFSKGFDALIPLLGLDPQPDIGWSFDGKLFSPPIPGPNTPLTFEPNYSTAFQKLWKGDPPLTLHDAIERLTVIVAQLNGGTIPSIPGDPESVPLPDLSALAAVAPIDPLADPQKVGK